MLCVVSGGAVGRQTRQCSVTSVGLVQLAVVDEHGHDLGIISCDIH